RGRFGRKRQQGGAEQCRSQYLARISDVHLFLSLSRFANAPPGNRRYSDGKGAATSLRGDSGCGFHAFKVRQEGGKQPKRRKHRTNQVNEFDAGEIGEPAERGGADARKAERETGEQARGL